MQLLQRFKFIEIRFDHRRRCLLFIIGLLSIALIAIICGVLRLLVVVVCSSEFKLGCLALLFLVITCCTIFYFVLILFNIIVTAERRVLFLGLYKSLIKLFLNSLYHPLLASILQIFLCHSLLILLFLLLFLLHLPVFTTWWFWWWIWLRRGWRFGRAWTFYLKHDLLFMSLLFTWIFLPLTQQFVLIFWLLCFLLHSLVK